MRELTLNQKICIKGALSKRGAPGLQIVRLTRTTTPFLWGLYYGYNPISNWHLFSR